MIGFLFVALKKLLTIGTLVSLISQSFPSTCSITMPSKTNRGYTVQQKLISLVRHETNALMPF